MSNGKFTLYNNEVRCATHHYKTHNTCAFCDTSAHICDDMFTPERQTTHRAQSLSYRIGLFCTYIHSAQFHTKPRVESNRKLIVTLQETRDSLAPLCTCSGVRPKPLLVRACSPLPWSISSVNTKHSWMSCVCQISVVTLP